MPMPVCFGMVSQELAVRERSRTGSLSNNVVQLVVVDSSWGTGLQIQTKREHILKKCSKNMFSGNKRFYILKLILLFENSTQKTATHMHTQMTKDYKECIHTVH